MVDRILRAIRLDFTVFREIAEDQSALNEAAIIVAVVTFFSAIGSAVGSGGFVVSFLVNWIVAILVGWLGWAALTWLVGTKMFKGDADIPEMMRVLGYASAPRILGIFGVIPCLGWIAALAGGILALIAGVLAIREAMDFETSNAILTVVISWVVVMIVTFAITIPLAGGMAVMSGMGG